MSEPLPSQSGHPESLRDRLAMVALPLIWNDSDKGEFSDIAKDAYELADEMMLARKKKYA